jgi:hypothetical protein
MKSEMFKIEKWFFIGTWRRKNEWGIVGSVENGVFAEAVETRSYALNAHAPISNNLS